MVKKILVIRLWMYRQHSIKNKDLKACSLTVFSQMFDVFFSADGHLVF